MKFLSEEWIAAFDAAAKEMFGGENSPSKLTVRLTEVYEDVPHLEGGLLWHSYALESGVLTDISHGYDRENLPAGADYTCYSTYEDVKKIMTGEVSVSRAMVSGMVRMEGNMIKAMKLLGTYNTIREMKKLDGKTEF